MFLKIKLLLSLFFSLFLTLSCRNDNDSKNEDDSTIRSGQVVTNIPLAQYEGNASLNSDGTKAVFLSGRSGVMRAYKLDLAATTPTTVSGASDLLTVSNETAVAISGNGEKIAVIANKSDARSDVYISDFTSEAEARLTALTENDHVESDVTFSRDSRLILFLSSQTGVLQSDINAVLLDANGAVSVAVSSLASEGFFQSYFVITSEDTNNSIYEIVIYETSTEDFSSRLVKKTVDFSSSQLSVTATEVISEDLNFDRSFGLKGGEDVVFYAKAVSEKTTALAYAKPELTDAQKAVTLNSSWSLSGFNLSFGSEAFDVEDYSLSLGDLSATSANGVFASLSTRPFSCDGSMNYARSIALYTKDGTANENIIWINASTTVTYGLELTTEPCSAQLNRSLVGVNLSSDSTAENYKMLVESQSTNYQKIYLLEKSVEASTIRILFP